MRDILGFEDDIVVNYVISGLRMDSSSVETEPVDARTVYLSLMGFLGRHTQDFMLSLWTVIIEMQQQKKPQLNHLQQQESVIQQKQKMIQEQQVKLQTEIRRLERLEKYWTMVIHTGEMERYYFRREGKRKREKE